MPFSVTDTDVVVILIIKINWIHNISIMTVVSYVAPEIVVEKYIGIVYLTSVIK